MQRSVLRKSPALDEKSTSFVCPGVSCDAPLPQLHTLSKPQSFISDFRTYNREPLNTLYEYTSLEGALRSLALLITCDAALGLEQ
jgi:hypothetical protein